MGPRTRPTRSLPIALLIAVSMGSVGTPAQAHGAADELDEVDDQIAALTNDLAVAERTHTDLAGALIETDTRMSELRAQLDSATHEVEAAETELETLRLQLDVLQRSVDQLLTEIVRTSAEVASTVDRLEVEAVELYMAAAGGESLIPLLVPSAEQGAVAVAYLADSAVESESLVRNLEALKAQEQRDLDELATRRAEMEQTTAAANQRRDELADRREGLATIAEQVEAERNRQQALLAQVDSDIELFESELAGLEREQARLKELLADEQEQGGSRPGRLSWPVQGRISSVYGYRTHPVTGARKLHSGLDIAAPSGTPLVAAAGGRIVLADWFGGYGLTVIIDHGGGVATLYAHQSRLAVSAGDTVGSGDLVGYVGSTGLSTGPHVHFEVRTQGTAEDPLPWLRG
ncbi:MAG: peptidoglycan DD-metalloendopeptidase family protein [Acidimicrobiia bacterium]|nr:peptidoglycan DD-metalloendopeptidase family protein [Acidimicrobiia bacterium]